MGAIFFLVLRIAILTILFVFVGWAIYTLWSEINYHRKQSAETRTPTILFTILFETDFRAEEQRSFTFNHSPILIGRDTSCDIYMQETTLSARHARIQYQHKQWWVEDLHSSNGTYLNDIPILSPIVIKSDDHLRCGEIEFAIKIGS